MNDKAVMNRGQAQARLEEINQHHAQHGGRGTTKEQREEAMHLASDFGLPVPQWVRAWPGPF